MKIDAGSCTSEMKPPVTDALLVEDLANKNDTSRFPDCASCRQMKPGTLFISGENELFDEGLW